MSRPIKFRVWDGVIDQMWYKNLDESDYSLWIDPYSGRVMLHSDYERRPKDEPSDHDIIPLLFTGLHDADGKEIYEGDVCSCSHKALKRDGEPWPVTGIIDTASTTTGHEFVFRRDGDLHVRELYRDEHDEYRVIGNIYENPELIDG